MGSSGKRLNWWSIIGVFTQRTFGEKAICTDLSGNRLNASCDASLGGDSTSLSWICSCLGT